LTTTPQVHVPLPDLSCFNQLLDGSTCRGKPDDPGVVLAAEASGERRVTMFFT
jgi:hypothetical protein